MDDGTVHHTKFKLEASRQRASLWEGAQCGMLCQHSVLLAKPAGLLPELHGKPGSNHTLPLSTCSARAGQAFETGCAGQEAGLHP